MTKQMVGYLQGGPLDLSKHVLDKMHNPLYIASMTQPQIMVGGDEHNAARNVNVKRLVYRPVGGYETAQHSVVVYAYDGEVPAVL